MQVRILGDETDKFFAVLSQEPGGVWDIALLTGSDQLLSVIFDMTGLDHAKESGGEFRVKLSLDGLVVLGLFLTGLDRFNWRDVYRLPPGGVVTLGRDARIGLFSQMIVPVAATVRSSHAIQDGSYATWTVVTALR